MSAVWLVHRRESDFFRLFSHSTEALEFIRSYDGKPYQDAAISLYLCELDSDYQEHIGASVCIQGEYWWQWEKQLKERERQKKMQVPAVGLARETRSIDELAELVEEI